MDNSYRINILFKPFIALSLVVPLLFTFLLPSLSVRAQDVVTETPIASLERLQFGT